jgi:hypothetical protein
MTFLGPIRTLLTPEDLDARLPQPHSLRRASDAAKAAVLVAVQALAGEKPTGRTGLYVGQQQIPLDYCRQFIDTSYAHGPRFASPMLFSESVANNAATHLSLTLGFRGAIQTFIGSRAAGIEAVRAAAEDVTSGAVDAGVVVVLSFAGPLTVEAYGAVYHARRRDRPPEPFPLANGAAAFLVRNEPFSGSRALEGTGLRCRGRSLEDRMEALRDLRREFPSGPALEAEGSVFCLAREESLRALRAALGKVAFVAPPGESFALDPILRLARGARTVAVLGEEGTAGMIALG